MYEAENVIRRQSQSRIERLQEALQGNCVPSCQNKTWLKMAEEILKNNNINKYVFAENVRNLKW